MITTTVQFPEFSGLRCLMIPFIQGEPDSIPERLRQFLRIVSSGVHGREPYFTVNPKLEAAA